MDAKDLINYTKLSLLLTKNNNGIRKNKCPKALLPKVQELENFITYFINKHVNND